MKASPNDQLQILDVQGMDFAVATLKNKALALSEIAELLANTQRSAVVRDLVIAAQTQISDIKRELLRSEADVEQVVSRLERDEKRLGDASSSPKELEKLQHEVATLSTRRSELEEVELEIMLRMDSVKERLDELTIESQTLITQCAQIEERKAAATLAIDNEILAIISQRKAAIATIDTALVDLYEKVRASTGTGAAAFSAGRCNGCHLAINSVELGRMKTLADDEVVRCEECRCILVRGAS